MIRRMKKRAKTRPRRPRRMVISGFASLAWRCGRAPYPGEVAEVWPDALVRKFRDTHPELLAGWEEVAQ